ncbi:hypothetical protein LIER_19822 [Lithospermum erythrorhizon]|uniref:Retrotransposon gag domain-containing protein n=1 Tax=Lithospermum erythrorhizon TaxID=34254 RepID=A0AAV3QK29_LITER
MPKFKTFGVYGDPGNHLKSFDSQLSFWASDDEVYARAFPSSLSGQALKWFHKLPSDSIDCWQDITDLFNDKFGASIVAEEDERTLMEIQQRPRETLRSFTTRFEEVATNIPMANEKVTLISFFHGLRYGPLKEKLVLEPPNTRNELSKLVIQYIKLEEVKLLSDEYSPKSERPKGRDDLRKKSPKRGRVWDRLQKPKEGETFRRQGARSPRKKMVDIAEIEKLISRGQLREFVKKDHGRPSRRREMTPPRRDNRLNKGREATPCNRKGGHYFGRHSRRR